MMEPTRRNWNTRQKELRTLLSDADQHSQAIDLFLLQHAEVHSGTMSSSGTHSFEDEVLRDLTNAQIREVPDRMDHSIAWVLWHLARIEDVTMNLLVAGKDQVFDRDGWGRKIGVSMIHTGNAMSRGEVVELSKSLDIGELRDYRIAIGRETELIVKQLEPGALMFKVSSSRLEQLMGVKAVPEDAEGIVEYWSKRTIAGLLLMPPTRHCFIHLNEANRIRRQVI